MSSAEPHTLQTLFDTDIGGALAPQEVPAGARGATDLLGGGLDQLTGGGGGGPVGYVINIFFQNFKYGE